MAEAMARDLYPQHNFYSAGIKTHGMNSYAIRVCHELGLDMSKHYSKNISSLNHIRFDVVITVCDHANEFCPVFTGRSQKLHHSFQDPPKLAEYLVNEEDKLVIYRKVRDQIKAYLMEQLPNLIKGT
jgi:arsenate reductase